MNNSFRYLVVFLLFVSMAANACKKGADHPKDFRDQYIGKYKVTEEINCYGPCRTCSSLKDTVIIIRYGLTDSTLNVFDREVFLDSRGYYTDYHFGLRLWNDSLSSSYMNGGLGCGQYERYNGIRISDIP